jgi:uncharacterized damage-inducible protein DinB
MNQGIRLLVVSGLLLATTGVPLAQTPRRIPTPAQSFKGHFASLNQRILDMAKDFPEEKYGFRPAPLMRSFGEVIVHILSGNVYAAKAGRGEKAAWDELNPKDFRTKAATVAALEKSIAEAKATLDSLPEDQFAKAAEPWLSVIEHSAEHYGLLVSYYRLNGLVPPATRRNLN